MAGCKIKQELSCVMEAHNYYDGSTHDGGKDRGVGEKEQDLSSWSAGLVECWDMYTHTHTLPLWND